MTPLNNPSYDTNSGFTNSRNTILLLFVALLIFLWSNGFNLLFFDFSDRFKLLNLAAIFIIAGLAGIRIVFTSKIVFTKNYYFWFIILILCAILFPTYINLVITSGLKPIEVLRSGFFYSGFFIFIILVSYQSAPNIVNKLNTIIIAMISFNVLFIVVFSFFPDLANSVFVHTMERFGRIRIGVESGLGPMTHYAFFYILIMCTQSSERIKSKILYFFLFGIYIWYFFAVVMSRRAIFVLLAIVGYYFLTRLNGKQRMRILLALPLVLSLLFVLPQSTIIVDSIQSSFVTAVEEFQYGEGNVGIRVFGIEYYLNLFKESGYMGIGMLSNRLPSSDPLLVGAEFFRYNPADHGIFAVLYQFGFPAIVLTIIVLYYIFRDLKAVRLQGMPEHWPIAMAIHLYLVFSIIGLLAIFWKPSESFWTGIMLFMIWKMKESTRVNLQTTNNS